MQMDWAPEHSEALREYLAKGMSHAEAAAINAKFSTAYSRSAAIGRARRMEFAHPDRPVKRNQPPQKFNLPRPQTIRAPAVVSKRLVPVSERADRVKLRCVQIVPRNLPLIELEASDCRYPYGGDDEGEAITFCGHPQREGSSYCIGHFHLTRGPGTASERAAVPVSLRLVEAA